MLKSLIPDEKKVTITINDFSFKSNLTTNKTIRFSEKRFFYRIFGFIQSHSGELGDIERFIQLTPGTYKSEQPNNNTGIDKVHLKCNVINGSLVNGIREPILFSFDLDQPPGRKLYEPPRTILFKKIC